MPEIKLVTEEVELVLAEVGIQGLPGKEGTSSTVEFPASAPLSGHRAIAVIAGQAVYADSSIPAHAYAVVGVNQAASAGGAGLLIYNNQLIAESTWNWIPGDPIFVGTNGLLTQIAPQAPPGVFVLQVARALSPRTIWVDVEQPIFF